jgi:hypothetical protein
LKPNLRPILKLSFRRSLSRQQNSAAWLPLLCLFIGLSNPMTLRAASNEDLMRIIERLEARIELLEASTAKEVPATGLPETSVTPDQNQPTSYTSPALNSFPSPETDAGASTLYLTDSPPVPPLELIPSLRTDAELGQGVWHLYLNIDADNKRAERQKLVWENVSEHFDVVDSSGVKRQLAVNISMTGKGERVKAGRSAFMQPYFDYDFRFVIRYDLALEDGRSMAGEKYLSSSVLGISRSGQIPNQLLYGEENLNKASLKNLPLVVQFGCNESTYKIENNLTVADRAMTDINRYACLRLSFSP